MSKIAELRKKKNLTQREFAIQLGISETTIRNWEHNREGVNMFERVASICNVLECSVYDLVEKK